MLAVSMKNVPLSQDHDLESSRNCSSCLTIPSTIRLLDMITYDISMNGLHQLNRVGLHTVPYQHMAVYCMDPAVTCTIKGEAEIANGTVRVTLQPFLAVSAVQLCTFTPFAELRNIFTVSSYQRTL